MNGDIYFTVVISLFHLFCRLGVHCQLQTLQINGQKVYLSNTPVRYRDIINGCRNFLGDHYKQFEPSNDFEAMKVIDGLHALNLTKTFWMETRVFMNIFGSIRLEWQHDKIHSSLWFSYTSAVFGNVALKPDGIGMCSTLRTRLGFFDSSTGKHMLSDDLCSILADYLCVEDPNHEPDDQSDPPPHSPPHSNPTTLNPPLWTQSTGTQSPGTQPPGTQPPGTQPPGTQPPGTQPPGTQPPGTQPPGTLPPGTQPIGTQPRGTQSPGTLPPGTQPIGTQPPETQPPGTLRPVTQPPGTLRPVTQPPGTQPIGTPPSGIGPTATTPQITDNSTTSGKMTAQTSPTTDGQMNTQLSSNGMTETPAPKTTGVVASENETHSVSDVVDSTSLTILPGQSRTETTTFKHSQFTNSTIMLNTTTTGQIPVKITKDTVPVIVCPCSCPNTTKSQQKVTAEFVQKLTTSIQKKLSVPVDNLSATTRKKTSAKDSRPTSKTAGFVCISVMSLIFGTIVLVDLIGLVNFICKMVSFPKS